VSELMSGYYSIASRIFLDVISMNWIEKRCNHYRQMMCGMLSEGRRVRPVIVACSTAPPAPAISLNCIVR
jgi:hypothetical protein